jgi:PAS domain S-box-containing protein
LIEHLESKIIEFMLNSLPVEISFVDKNDEVCYFNKNGDRIFPRPRSVIGKKVQQCHPKKSLNKVIEIVEAFKNGKKDVANFWINLNDRLIFIRYFAVRDNTGKYLGTLEVSQDITDIKKIEGEKRLLDWE